MAQSYFSSIRSHHHPQKSPFSVTHLPDELPQHITQRVSLPVPAAHAARRIRLPHREATRPPKVPVFVCVSDYVCMCVPLFFNLLAPFVSGSHTPPSIAFWIGGNMWPRAGAGWKSWSPSGIASPTFSIVPLGVPQLMRNAFSGLIIGHSAPPLLRIFIRNIR